MSVMICPQSSFPSLSKNDFRDLLNTMNSSRGKYPKFKTLALGMECYTRRIGTNKILLSKLLSFLVFSHDKILFLVINEVSDSNLVWNRLK